MHTVLQSLAKTWETPTKESDKICICQRKVMQMKRQSRRMMGKEISSRDVLDKIPYKCIPKIYSIQTRRDFVLILCKNRRDFRLWSSIRRTKSNRLLSLQEQMTYPGKRNDYQEHVSSNHAQQDEQQVSDDVEKKVISSYINCVIEKEMPMSTQFLTIFYSRQDISWQELVRQLRQKVTQLFLLLIYLSHSPITGFQAEEVMRHAKNQRQLILSWLS